MVGERWDHILKLGMMQRHDSGDCVKLTKLLRVLDALLDQAGMRRCGGIRAERGEAKLGQAVNKSAVTASDIEDARARGDRRPEDRVEILPPPRIGHTAETYQSSASKYGCRGPISLDWSARRL
jgi:hypothetical protein